MATRLRKTRKLRGSRTHGWGRSGQHRNSGSQGGHGNAGWKRHKWSAVIRYGLKIQETGFTPVRRKYARVINISDLNEHIGRFMEEGIAKQSNGKIEVDLHRAGYTKLLGEGTANKPLKVIIAECTERAAERISGAGGEVIRPPQKNQD